MDEWLNKMWSIQAKGYYSMLKTKKILTPYNMDNSEDMMLSIGLSQRTNTASSQSQEVP